MDKDEAFGAIKETPTGQANLFLAITGTTSNYKVSYDKQATVQKAKSDIKKEVQELKEIFRNKGKQQEDDLGLEEEYFDWQADSTDINRP